MSTRSPDRQRLGYLAQLVHLGFRKEVAPSTKKWLHPRKSGFNQRLSLLFEAFAAMLYHSDSIQDCQKFMAISDAVGDAWKAGGAGATVTTDEEEEKGEKTPAQTVTTEQD